MSGLSLSEACRDDLMVIQRSIRKHISAANRGTDRPAARDIFERKMKAFSPKPFRQLVTNGVKPHDSTSLALRILDVLEGDLPDILSDAEVPLTSFKNWLKNQSDTELWSRTAKELRIAVGIHARPSKISELDLVNIDTPAPQYSVKTVADLVSAGAEVSDILHDIDEIYALFPADDHPGNDMGDDEKWALLYREFTSYVHCLVHGKEGVVGFWSCFPVDQTIFDAGLRGENINRAMTIDDIDTMAFPGEYTGYFIDFFVNRAHLSTLGANRHLYDSFVQFIVRRAENGYFFREIFAHASTPEAIKICQHAGFLEITDHQCHVMKNRLGELVPTKIYALDLSKCTGALFELSPDLKVLYEGRYLS